MKDLLRRPIVSEPAAQLARGAAVLALVLLALQAFLPAVEPYVALLLATVVLNGPQGIFMPTGYEPVMMAFARLLAPLPVAAVATVGACLVEPVNLHVYRRVLDAKFVAKMRTGRHTRRVVGWFGLAPALTTFVCAFTPLPFWPARALAILGGYSRWRFVLAEGLGRFPRYLLYGTLGTVIPVSDAVFICVALSFALLVTLLSLWKLRKGRPS